MVAALGVFVACEKDEFEALDEQFAIEVARLDAADDVLASSIEDLRSDFEAFVADINERLASAVAALEAADEALEAYINSEIAELEGKLDAAVAALSASIKENTDFIKDVATELNAKIHAESQARVAADLELANELADQVAKLEKQDSIAARNIQSNAGSIIRLGSALSQEVARLNAADADIRTTIATVSSTLNTLRGDVTLIETIDIPAVNARIQAYDNHLDANGNADLSGLIAELTIVEDAINHVDTGLEALNRRVNALDMVTGTISSSLGTITSNFDVSVSALTSGRGGQMVTITVGSDVQSFNIYNGIQGNVGQTGQTGQTGNVGPQGPIGPQGPVGRIGQTGNVGSVGPAGASFDADDFRIVTTDVAEGTQITIYYGAENTAANQLAQFIIADGEDGTDGLDGSTGTGSGVAWTPEFTDQLEGTFTQHVRVDGASIASRVITVAKVGGLSSTVTSTEAIEGRDYSSPADGDQADDLSRIDVSEATYTATDAEGNVIGTPRVVAAIPGTFTVSNDITPDTTAPVLSATLGGVSITAGSVHSYVFGDAAPSIVVTADDGSTVQGPSAIDVSVAGSRTQYTYFAIDGSTNRGEFVFTIVVNAPDPVFSPTVANVEALTFGAPIDNVDGEEYVDVTDDNDLTGQVTLTYTMTSSTTYGFALQGATPPSSVSQSLVDATSGANDAAPGTYILYEMIVDTYVYSYNGQEVGRFSTDGTPAPHGNPIVVTPADTTNPVISAITSLEAGNIINVAHGYSSFAIEVQTNEGLLEVETPTSGGFDTSNGAVTFSGGNAAGRYEYTFRATDASNNVGSLTITVVVAAQTFPSYEWVVGSDLVTYTWTEVAGSTDGTATSNVPTALPTNIPTGRTWMDDQFGANDLIVVLNSAGVEDITVAEFTDANSDNTYETANADYSGFTIQIVPPPFAGIPYAANVFFNGVAFDANADYGIVLTGDDLAAALAAGVAGVNAHYDALNP